MFNKFLMNNPTSLLYFNGFDILNLLVFFIFDIDLREIPINIFSM